LFSGMRLLVDRKKEEMASCLATCFWFTEVGGIAVDCEDHVGGAISYYAIRSASSVV
jgi:hypothetical protein